MMACSKQRHRNPPLVADSPPSPFPPRTSVAAAHNFQRDFKEKKCIMIELRTFAW